MEREDRGRLGRNLALLAAIRYPYIAVMIVRVMMPNGR